ncbi:MAG: sensor histidine kinase, partial [Blastomonas fulva]
PKVDAAGMAIGSTFGPGAPEKVYGDANRTAQLLTNLIENAARHSGGKLIEVKIEGAPDGQYAMTVSDDGVGIAEDALPLMMRSFAQVDGSMSSAEGFGLGLAICKGLAELMGGSIALDSPPGSGLHVKICMPAEVTLSKAA